MRVVLCLSLMMMAGCASMSSQQAERGTAPVVQSALSCKMPATVATNSGYCYNETAYLRSMSR